MPQRTEADPIDLINLLRQLRGGSTIGRPHTCPSQPVMHLGGLRAPTLAYPVCAARLHSLVSRPAVRAGSAWWDVLR